MNERPEDVHFLRGMAARLRSLAMTEPRIGDQLQQIADEAESRADAIEARHRPR